MLGQPDHLAGQEPGPARPSAGGLEQAVATRSASSLPESLRSRSRPRLLAERRLQVAFDEAALRPVHVLIQIVAL